MSEKKFMDFMVDLECLDGQSKSPVIMEISGVLFDITTGKIKDELSIIIDPSSCVKKGLTINGSTLEWWLIQDREVIKDVIGNSIMNGVDLESALLELTQFYEKMCKKYELDYITLWGNGPSADCAWISSAYQSCGMKNPFLYSKEYCVRTIVRLGKELLGIDPKSTRKFIGNKHKGLDDAKHQAKYVSDIYRAFLNK